MLICLPWLNRYLDPGDVTADEADRLLTAAGFPIESVSQGPRGETILDVEVTSNRGDCLSHLGCAREIAASALASTPRRLLAPESAHPAATPAIGPPIASALTLENRVHDRCPLFTARLIRGVKVAPSPDWLVHALESIGARSINNVVDITNFITFELGNPCHVFDHAKLAGGALIVRPAETGERIKTLYEGEHKLAASDLVVADAERPQSLAGVIGGYDSQVDDATTDVVFEMATWAPVSVRNTGRRLNIRTDAAYRFERGIDPRTIEAAAERAAALICSVAGGELAQGVLREGPPLPESRIVELRPARSDLLLGVHTEPSRIVSLLTPLGIACEPAGDALRCTIPPHRAHDLTREIDLIEEVARTRSIDEIPVRDTLSISIHQPQPDEACAAELASLLTGLGYYETVTFSFTSPKRAELFIPAGASVVAVDDDRRKAEPSLRPSALAGLLGVRAANDAARVQLAGGVRLFEVSAVFGEHPGAGQSPQTDERRELALLADVPVKRKAAKPEELQQGLRLLRGAIEQAVRVCFGPDAELHASPVEPDRKSYRPDAHAMLRVERAGTPPVEIGRYGLVSDAALAAFDLKHPLAAAELNMPALVSGYPPAPVARALPQFPAIERDVSLSLPERTPWGDVAALARSLGLDLFEGHALVGVFRGEQAGAGRKSVTIRLRFRDPARTLRHEEVDPQVEAFTAAARERLSAEVRTG
ncbi:MAG: phenylalanine--tRNA ligase subunit beta [Planctomycetota bacterium]